MRKFIRKLGRGFRYALIGIGALAVSGGIVAIADYSLTQGAGTTFASVVVASKHYIALLICDATAGESQCSAVDSSGRVAIQAPPTLPLPTGASTSANQTSQITQETAINTVLGVPGTAAGCTAGASSTSIACQYQAALSLATIATNTGAAIPAGTNVIGFTSNDACAQLAKIPVAIATTASTTELVVGTTNKKTWICSLALIVGAAETINLIEGTGIICTGGTSVAVIGSTVSNTGMELAANGGLTYGNGSGTIAATANNANNLCLLKPGSAQVSGNLTYVQQ